MKPKQGLEPFLLWGTFDHWGKAAKNIADELNGRAYGFGLIYLAEGHLPDLGSVLTFLRETTNVTHWLGAVVPGILVNDMQLELRHGYAVLALDLDVQLFDGADSSAVNSQIAGKNSAALVLGYQRLGLPELLQDAAKQLSLFGGAVSNLGSSALWADQMVTDGIAGVIFPPHVVASSQLAQGCTPIGPLREVTSSQDGIVMQIDNQASLDVLKEDVGELIARDLRKASGYIHMAIPIGDGPDYMVRTLLGIDPRHGWLALTDRMETGAQVMFVRRDPDAAREQILSMVHGVIAKARGRKILAAHVTISAGRGEHLFGEYGMEMRLITEALEEMTGRVPIIGFQSAGEILGPRVYNYTAILSLILAPTA